jgi:hypothetical protein
MYLYNKTGYKLEGEDNVLTAETYENYFQKFAKDYAPYRSANPTLLKITQTDHKSFILEFEIDAEFCGTCDEMEATQDRCAGHGEPHYEEIYYELLDLFI